MIPSLREWYQTYNDDGFVIIGVHTPEFEWEKDINNVRDAIQRFDVPYPVAIDNDWKTWRSYRNRYWPAAYLIDKTGQIRYVKIGEGGYEKTERIIQALLAEDA